MDEQTRTLVLEHQKSIGSLCADMETVKDQQKKLFNMSEEHLTQLAELTSVLKNGFSSKMEKVDAIGKDVENLKNISWFPKLIDKGSRKIVGVIILIIIMNAVFSNAFWAYLRTNYFKGPPGLVQSLADQHAESHYHILPDKTLFVHSHKNPDGPKVLSHGN